MDVTPSSSVVDARALVLIALAVFPIITHMATSIAVNVHLQGSHGVLRKAMGVLCV